MVVSTLFFCEKIQFLLCNLSVQSVTNSLTAEEI